MVLRSSDGGWAAPHIAFMDLPLRSVPRSRRLSQTIIEGPISRSGLSTFGPSDLFPDVGISPRRFSADEHSLSLPDNLSYSGEFG